MTAWAALAGVLRALEDAVLPLTADAFTRRALRSSGSIGAHVRHCLDHVAALERGIVTGEVCYDTRERDTIVERDRHVAIARLRRAAARVTTLGEHLLDRPLVLRARVAETGAAVSVTTSVGRELAFVISHTIHHSALVAVLLEEAEADVPPRFGLAPTTPDRVCAR